jgi:hypothetical protein
MRIVKEHSFHEAYVVFSLQASLRTFLSHGCRRELDGNLKRFLETVVRDIILNGNAKMGLRVLDPLEIEHFDIDIDQKNIR